MKDRKFWEEHISKTQNVIKSLESIVGCVSQELMLRTSVTAPYRNKVKERKLHSRRSYLYRKRSYLIDRITFYQGRILALEQRTRYQRILRSPVIPWPNVRSMQSPMGRQST